MSDHTITKYTVMVTARPRQAFRAIVRSTSGSSGYGYAYTEDGAIAAAWRDYWSKLEACR